MTASLAKKVAVRIEHTGDPAKDRAQLLARQNTQSHEQTRIIVAALMNRVFAALAVDVAIGVAAYVALLSTTITTVLAKGNIDIHFTASGANSTATANARFLVLVDGVAVKGTYGFTNAGDAFSAALVVRVAVTAGPHTIAVQWKSDAGAARINAKSVQEEHAHLLVAEAP